MHWLKIHHGFSSNRKFGLIAHQTQIPRAIINAIILDLLEYASAQKERGSILGYDQEEAAFNLGVNIEAISKIYKSLKEREFLENDRIKNWDEYQDNDKTAAERQRRYRENKKNNDLIDGGVTGVTRNVTSRYTEEIRREEKEKKEKKDNNKLLSKKISLAELSISHISDWLNQKHSQGKYLLHDPVFILEQFKQYCEANGKTYKNYIAAYQNAFEWEKCQPHKKPNQPQKEIRTGVTVL